MVDSGSASTVRRASRAAFGVGPVRPPLACLALAALLLTPAAVAAEQLPQDNNGIKLGDARMHPFVELDGHHVVNPGRLPANAPSDMVIVGRGGVDIELPSDTLDLDFRGDLEYQRYLGLEDEATKKLSTLAGRLGLDMNLNKQGAVGIRVHESFVRGADPANEALTRRLLRISNDVGLGLDIRPGGGALVFSPEVSFFYERYDRSDTGMPNPEILDNYRLMPQLRISWKFLPKTAIFLEGQGVVTRFPESDLTRPTNILLAQLGLAGSLTQRIAVLLKAGYGNTFTDDPEDNFESFVGQAELNYLTSATTRFRIGALRTVHPTSLFTYFDLIRGYVGIDQAFGGKLVAGAKLSYNYLVYGQASRGPPDRADGNLLADVTLSYQLTEWLVISAVERLDWRITSYQTLMRSSAAYVHNDVFLRVGARY